MSTGGVGPGNWRNASYRDPANPSYQTVNGEKDFANNWHAIVTVGDNITNSLDPNNRQPYDLFSINLYNGMQNFTYQVTLNSVFTTENLQYFLSEFQGAVDNVLADGDLSEADQTALKELLDNKKREAGGGGSSEKANDPQENPSLPSPETESPVELISEIDEES